MFTEMMTLFVQEPAIKKHYKSRLVGVVLNGYLSLRRLIVQRTKLIDDTQEKLLELLEDMTTGRPAVVRILVIGVSRCNSVILGGAR